MIAIVAVVIVVAAAAATVILGKGSEARDEEINLVAGLEGVGSGFYYDPKVVDAGDLFELNDDGTLKTRSLDNGDRIVVFKPSGWEKLRFGVPTVGSIQYYQLKTIVEVYLADPAYTDGTTANLKLVAYTEGTPLKDGEVGYIVTQGSASSIKEYQKNGLYIGITWDPQYSILTVGDGATFEGLVTTDLIFPHVTCCVLYGNKSYVDANRDTSERLVWAIYYATRWVYEVSEDIKANGFDPADETHRALVDYAIQYSGGVSSGLSDETVVSALHSIEYAWGDGDMYGTYDPENPLSKIKEDIANQSEILYDIGSLNYSHSDLGFRSWSAFADSFVDDSLIKTALKTDRWDSTSTKTVRFSFIVGDMHQLPVHLASEVLPRLSEVVGNDSLDDARPLFEQTGVNIVGISASGSAQVITQLSANESDFAVAAQPGVIAYDINGKFTTA